MVSYTTVKNYFGEIVKFWTGTYIRKLVDIIIGLKVRLFYMISASLHAMKLKSCVLTTLFDMGVVSLLVFLSIRSLLLSPGFMDYADIGWPLNPSLYGTINFIPGLVIKQNLMSLFQLTRDFLTFIPFFITRLLNPDQQEVERIYISFGLFLFYFVALKFARYLVRNLLKSFSIELTKVNRSIAEAGTFVFIISNFVSMNLIVDGGFLSVDIIVIMMSLTFIILTRSRALITESLVIGALLSLSVLLDPDYYLAFIVFCLFLVVLFGTMNGNLFKRLATISVAILVSLPALIFIEYSLYVISAPQTSILFYRSLSSIGFGSENRLPLYSLALLGHSWQVMTFGPPNILFYGEKVYEIHGLLNPTQLLLPSQFYFVTILWIFAVYSIPILCFLSLLFRRARKLSVPLSTIALVGVYFSDIQPNNPLIYLFNKVITLPLVGPSLETSLSLPGHFLVIVAAAYFILFPLTIIFLLSSGTSLTSKFSNPDVYHDEILHIVGLIDSMKDKTPGLVIAKYYFMNFKRLLALRSKVKYLAIAFILLMVFANWQFIDGSYYPARADNGFFQGNGVPNSGSFSPFSVPAGYIDAYNYLVNKSQSVNVFLEPGFAVPPNMRYVPLSGLPFLISNHLLNDITPYLNVYSVRYIGVVLIKNFTQPLFYPTRSVAQLYQFYFGLQNFDQIVSALNSTPGLKNILSNGVVSLYENQNATSLYYRSNILLHYDSTSYPFAYSILNEIGYNASGTYALGFGIPISFDSFAGEICVVSPTYLQSIEEESLPVKTINNFEIDSPGIYYANSNISITRWAGDPIVNYSNNTFTFASKNYSLVSIEYGGAVVANQLGGVKVNNVSLIATLNVDVLNNTLPGSGIEVSAIGDNFTGQTTLYQTNRINIVPGSSGHVTLQFNIPISIRNFAIEVVAGFSGSVAFSNYNLTLVAKPLNLLKNYNSTLGYMFKVDNTTVMFPIQNFSGQIYIKLVGTGTVNHLSINYASNHIYSTFLSLGESVIVNGNLNLQYILFVRSDTLDGVVGSYLLYNTGSSKVFSLMVKGYSGSHITSSGGTNLYTDVPASANISISSASTGTLEVWYILTLAFIFALIMIVIMVTRRDRNKAR